MISQNALSMDYYGDLQASWLKGLMNTLQYSNVPLTMLMGSVPGESSTPGLPAPFASQGSWTAAGGSNAFCQTTSEAWNMAARSILSVVLALEAQEAPGLVDEVLVEVLKGSGLAWTRIAKVSLGPPRTELRLLPSCWWALEFLGHPHITCCCCIA